MNHLTNAEKDLLQEMLTRYNEYINEKENTAGDFIWLAHETGDIASSGEKYTNNRKFWEVRDNIRTMLSEKKITANKLIIKIINQP